MFIGHAELLDANETTQDHQSSQRAETKKLDDDRKNTDPIRGGLFEGAFNKVNPDGEPIQDHEDGVARCPHCWWELEDGECNQCGFAIDESDWDSEDESDMDLPVHDVMDMIHRGLHPHFHPEDFGDATQASDASSVNSSDDDGTTSEMDSFIDDEPPSVPETVDSSHSTVVAPTHRNRPRSESRDIPGIEAPRNHVTIADSSDEEPIRPEPRRRRRSIHDRRPSLATSINMTGGRIDIYTDNQSGSNSRNPITMYDSDSPRRPGRRRSRHSHSTRMRNRNQPI